MCHVMSKPDLLMSTETIKRVTKYVIKLHNMATEVRLFQAPADKDKFTEWNVVSSGRKPMWKGRVLMTSMTDVSEEVSKVVERVTLEAFTYHVNEHDLTKRLLMEPVSYHYSEM